MKQKPILIIGAGPAGLTVAYELSKKIESPIVVVENSPSVGGLSQNIYFKDKIIDIGGHRFYTGYKRVIQFWNEIYPFELKKENNSKFLIKKREVAILFNQKMFDYPIRLQVSLLWKLGFYNFLNIIRDYLKERFKRKKEITNLEEILISRFGKKLYELFFKEYTLKVWGIPSNKIKPEWADQGIDPISIRSILLNSLKNFSRKKTAYTLSALEEGETFLYPKLGPGAFWEEVHRRVSDSNTKFMYNHSISEIQVENNEIKKIIIINNKTMEKKEYSPEFVFSSIPIKDLFNYFPKKTSEENLFKIAAHLQYRDYVIVPFLVKKFSLPVKKPYNYEWVYINTPEVKLARLQIFDNWSPFLNKEKDLNWIGVEYFCNEGDLFWNKPDKEIIKNAINELKKINILTEQDVVDSTIIRKTKAYPVYSGSFIDLDKIHSYLNNIKNLYPIGRNGMHRYLNLDQVVLTAISSVEMALSGKTVKDSLWKIGDPS